MAATSVMASSCGLWISTSRIVAVAAYGWCKTSCPEWCSDVQAFHTSATDCCRSSFRRFSYPFNGLCFGHGLCFLQYPYPLLLHTGRCSLPQVLHGTLRASSLAFRSSAGDTMRIITIVKFPQVPHTPPFQQCKSTQQKTPVEASTIRL